MCCFYILFCGCLLVRCRRCLGDLFVIICATAHKRTHTRARARARSSAAHREFNFLKYAPVSHSFCSYFSLFHCFVGHIFSFVSFQQMPYTFRMCLCVCRLVPHTILLRRVCTEACRGIIHFGLKPTSR